MTGYGIRISDRDAAITDAHDMCGYLSSGYSHEQAAAKLRTYTPTLTVDDADVFVDGAVRAYCPQYAVPAP